jgi:trehalose-phosphatase
MTATFPEAAITLTLDAVARGSSLLALDYDGTLAPFRVERDQARPPAELRVLLRRLAATTSTRVVVVSGRPVADLEALLEVDPLPEIYGVHGWEHRRTDGSRADRALPAEVARALEAELDRLEAGADATRVERKSAGLALHWRGLETTAAAELETRVGARWRALAGEHGLELLGFDGGLELRHPGRSKGHVMRELLGTVPEGAAVAYLGDDETDEAAFRALAERGLAVLVAAERRVTAAHEVIAHHEVAAFLGDWLARAEAADA